MTSCGSASRRGIASASSRSASTSRRSRSSTAMRDWSFVASSGSATRRSSSRFVGRLVPIKRADVLLRALALARRSCAVAAARRRRRRAEARSRGARPRARDRRPGPLPRLPARPDEDRSGATDVAVLTSANEGTPVSLIEAAAAGSPAVATAVGGVADVVTPETGILVGSGDSRGGGGRASCDSAADPALRARMGAAARDRALRRYSAARLIADIDALYGELLSRHGVRE